MRSIRLSDAKFANSLIGKYGWLVGQSSSPRGLMVHREGSPAGASSEVSLHVDVHLKHIRSMLKMVNLNVKNTIEQQVRAESRTTERQILREIREIAARAEQPLGLPATDRTPASRGVREAKEIRGNAVSGQMGQAGQAGQDRHRAMPSGEAARKPEEPLQHRTEKSAEPAANGQAERKIERPSERQIEKQIEKQLEKQIETQIERRNERQTEREIEIERQVERQIERQIESRIERQVERNVERTIEHQIERRLESRTEQETEQRRGQQRDIRNANGSPKPTDPNEGRTAEERVEQVLEREARERQARPQEVARLERLVRRIETIDLGVSGPVAREANGGGAMSDRMSPLHVDYIEAFAPRTLAKGFAARVEMASALRQVTHWIRNQAWRDQPAYERMALPEYRSWQGLGIVHRTTPSLAQGFRRTGAAVEQLREWLGVAAAGSGSERARDGASDRARGSGSASWSAANSVRPADGDRLAARQSNGGGAAAWHPAQAVLRQLLPLAASVVRMPGQSTSLIREMDRAAEMKRGASGEERVPGAAVPQARPGRRTRADELPLQAEDSARLPSVRQAGRLRPAREDRGEAFMVLARPRQEDYLLGRAIGQLRYARRLREQIEQRHGAQLAAAQSVASQSATRGSLEWREARADRETTRAAAREEGGNARSATAVAVVRQPRASTPFGQTVLRSIARTGLGVAPVADRAPLIGSSGRTAAEGAGARQGTGAARQEHRQVGRVRVADREAIAAFGSEESQTARSGTESVMPASDRNASNDGNAASANGSGNAARPGEPGRSADSGRTVYEAEASSTGHATASAGAGASGVELRHVSAADPASDRGDGRTGSAATSGRERDAAAPRQTATVRPSQGQGAASRPGISASGNTPPERFTEQRATLRYAMLRSGPPLRRGAIRELAARIGAAPRPGAPRSAPQTGDASSPSAQGTGATPHAAQTGTLPGSPIVHRSPSHDAARDQAGTPLHVAPGRQASGEAPRSPSQGAIPAQAMVSRRTAIEPAATAVRRRPAAPASSPRGADPAARSAAPRVPLSHPARASARLEPQRRQAAAAQAERAAAAAAPARDTRGDGRHPGGAATVPVAQQAQTSRHSALPPLGLQVAQRRMRSASIADATSFAGRSARGHAQPPLIAAQAPASASPGTAPHAQAAPGARGAN
ncbi:hypothetical protein E6C55_17475, partial [Cohnella fermenti]